MTITFAKKLVACVALSTVCLTSTAHAADAFNKFSTQSAASTQQTVQLSTYTVIAPSKTKTFNKKRTLKRVVEPVTTTASFLVNDVPTGSANRFNKMATQDQKASREMPVLNTHAVTIR